MALKESLNIVLGTPMHTFELFDPYGKVYKSSELKGSKGLLVIFTCNHCPYAQALWPRVINLAQFAEPLGIKTIAINPNINPDYPDDSPEKMKEYSQKMEIFFPYLVDQTQEVARLFQAQCTPDIYLFDQNEALVYHGRVDDNWKDESQVKKQELKEALQNLAEGKTIDPDQKPSMGCSIKWKIQ